MKKYIIILIGIILLLLSLVILKQSKYDDTVIYNNNTYVYLETNMDIFTYSFNSNRYYEEDIIHPIKHDKWNMVYFNGDLFVYEKEAKDAIKFYKNDNNYSWSILIENKELDIELEESINITKEELKKIYDLDKEKKDYSIKFDDIEKFGSLIKTSKDKTMFGIMSLAYHNGYWYYKTEIMTTDDKEYIIKLPKSVNEKINNLMK